MPQSDDDLKRLLQEVGRENADHVSNTETATTKFVDFVKDEKKSFLQKAHEKVKKLQINIERNSLYD